MALGRGGTKMGLVKSSKKAKLLEEIAVWLVKDCGSESCECEFKELDCPNSDSVSCERAEFYHKIKELLK